MESTDKKKSPIYMNYKYIQGDIGSFKEHDVFSLKKNHTDIKTFT